MEPITKEQLIAWIDDEIRMHGYTNGPGYSDYQYQRRDIAIEILEEVRAYVQANLCGECCG